MTPPGKRVQTLNAPGSEVGPGTVATWQKLQYCLQKFLLSFDIDIHIDSYFINLMH
jgi:hypothetical protein